MDLSIVTTLYNSSPFIIEFHTRVVAAASQLVDDFEIIYVNDGSPDESLDLAVQIAERDPRVRVVDLSRNFGHHQAVMAGLREASGDKVFLLDVDLEEQPEWLDKFWSVLDEQHADVVFGVAETRRGNLFKKFSGRIFYKLFNAASDTPIPENVCTVRLMNRRYTDAILGLRESNLFLAGLFAWAGFRQVPVVVPKGARVRGSNYGVVRMVGLFVRAITSFSSYPLWIVFVLGVALTGFSLVGAAVLAIRKLLDPATILLGYASIMVSIWFLGGLIIALLGIIGLYLGGIFIETKNRPQYVVRSVYGQNSIPQKVSAGLALTKRGDSQ